MNTVRARPPMSCGRGRRLRRGSTGWVFTTNINPCHRCRALSAAIRWFACRGLMVRAFYVWRQGHAAPIGVVGGDEILDRLPPDRVPGLQRLPERFSIGTVCRNNHVVEAIGSTEDGVWTGTELVEFDWRPKASAAD